MKAGASRLHSIFPKFNFSRYDIIRIDVVDDYLNLTLKTMAMMKWISKYCNTAKYIVKLDDDTLVNIPALFKLLRMADEKQMKNTILSRISKSHSINMFGKAKSLWDINNQSYPLSYWPHYANGFFYIFTNDITEGVLKRITNRTTPVVNIEDVFLTGIVRVLENISLIDIPASVSLCNVSRDQNIAVHHYDYTHDSCALPRYHRRQKVMHKAVQECANKTGCRAIRGPSISVKTSDKIAAQRKKYLAHQVH